MGRYSETLMDHFIDPRNAGSLEHPDRVGLAGTPGLGPYLVLHLALEGRRVAEARFRCHGCGPTIAAGSMLTELIVGRALEACLGLTADDLVVALDGVPPEKLHGPHLAIAALRDALGVG